MAKARLESVEQKLQELRVELKREQNDLRLSVEMSLSEFGEKLEESLSEFGQRLEEICLRLDESAPNPNGCGVKAPMHQGRTPANAQNSPLAFPSIRSLEIPKFGGDNPRTWIMKCEWYFLANSMPDVEKMILAPMYMEGRAETFYENYIEGREVEWGTFAEMVVEFFADPREQDLVGVFNKLEQKSSVEVYRDKFEELKYFMVQSYGTFTEEYFVQSFLSGLKQEIGMMVEMLNPTTLDRAIQLAKLHEMSLELTGEHDKNFMKDLQTSAYALATGSAQNTIKLRGKVKKNSLSILVVKGSDHSFLDYRAAKRIGCKLEYNIPFLVTVAGGWKMDCHYRCKGFEWKMGNRTFTDEVRIAKLGGYDMIIGVDLLSSWDEFSSILINNT